MVGVVLAGVIGSGLAAAPASATPEIPSEQEIDEAREAEHAAGGAVAVLEARLSDLTARADELYVRVASAVEAFNGARIRLAEAEQAEERRSEERRVGKEWRSRRSPQQC